MPRADYTSWYASYLVTTAGVSCSTLAYFLVGQKVRLCRGGSLAIYCSDLGVLICITQVCDGIVMWFDDFVVILPDEALPHPLIC